MLLEHGKFDGEITSDTDDSDFPVGEPFKTQSQNLINEFIYRLDGPMYNQNIL